MLWRHRYPQKPIAMPKTLFSCIAFYFSFFKSAVNPGMQPVDYASLKDKIFAFTNYLTRAPQNYTLGVNCILQITVKMPMRTWLKWMWTCAEQMRTRLSCCEKRTKRCILPCTAHWHAFYKAVVLKQTFLCHWKWLPVCGWLINFYTTTQNSVCLFFDNTDKASP